MKVMCSNFGIINVIMRDDVRLSVQVRELCRWSDKCNCTFLDKVECKTVIDFLCTD